MVKLVVADSSYITEGLLKDSSLFDGYIFCCPDYGLYEVLNAIWKHQVLLKRIKDSRPILDIFFDLIDAKTIRFLNLSEKVCKDAFKLALKAKMPFYDVAFIALARDLGVELKTFDVRQSQLHMKYH